MRSSYSALKHAIKFPSEEFALALGLALSLCSNRAREASETVRSQNKTTSFLLFIESSERMTGFLFAIFIGTGLPVRSPRESQNCRKGTIINSMTRFAVDIALLPSDEMTNTAISMNKTVVGQNANEMVLNTVDCLPHCTLAMGFIDSKDLEIVIDKLRTISKRFNAPHLISRKLDFGRMSSGYEVVALNIEKMPELQKLHETINNELIGYVGPDGSGDDFYKPQDDKALSYIKNFRAVASFEKYNPHITIGLGKLENVEFPVKFTADKLALCHLGDNYTCAKLLWSEKLRQEIDLLRENF